MVNTSKWSRDESMMYAGRFKFLKIFHHHDFEKLLSKAVEAFKVWACKRITAG